MEAFQVANPLEFSKDSLNWRRISASDLERHGTARKRKRRRTRIRGD